MRGHFARLARIRDEEGIHAAAAADIGAWGAALDEHDLRKMTGLQVANTHWILLEDYLGTELDPPVKTRFREISTPASVVVGGRDFAGTRLWAERIVSQAPGATLTVLAEADHFPMLSAPRAFELLVRETLRRVDAG